MLGDGELSLSCGKGDGKSVFLEAWRTRELGWEGVQRER